MAEEAEFPLGGEGEGGVGSAGDTFCWEEGGRKGDENWGRGVRFGAPQAKLTLVVLTPSVNLEEIKKYVSWYFGESNNVDLFSHKID